MAKATRTRYVREPRLWFNSHNYSETGDYSYDPTKTAFANWSKVTLYRNGVLVWGTEP